MPKRILVVDDHPRIRELVRFFLGGQPEFDVCGEAIDGLDAIEKAETLKPDLIILDLASWRWLRPLSYARDLFRYIFFDPFVPGTPNRPPSRQMNTLPVAVSAQSHSKEGKW